MTPLREEMIRQLQLQRLAPNTQQAYVRAVKGLAGHYDRSPDQISIREIRAYLHYLLVERELSWSSCNVAACGIGFFCSKVLGWESAQIDLPPRTRPKRLPEVLSREEIRRLFDAAQNPKHRALLMTVYGGGLRASEVVSLKLVDIESDQMTIRVEQGKGRKDRHTILSAHLLQELRAYWRIERPPVWMFPGPNPDRPLTRSSVHNIFHAAKAKAGILRGKGVHTLRHCFATHMLEDGVDSTVIQAMLGHACISTTARYLHVSRRHLAAVESPLDTLIAGSTSTL